MEKLIFNSIFNFIDTTNMLSVQQSRFCPVPQGSILSPLFFIIYINNLSENLKSTVKLFADNTSLFHVVKDPHTSAEILNHDLTRISEWAYRWKMSFNPDLSKRAQEVLFSNKLRRQIIQILYLMVTRYKKVPIKSTWV